MTDELDAARMTQNLESALSRAEVLRGVEPIDQTAAILVAATFLAGTQGFVAAWQLSGWDLERAVDSYVAMMIASLRDMAD